MWHLLSNIKLSSINNSNNCNKIVLIVKSSKYSNNKVINCSHNRVTNIMYYVDIKKWKLM